MGPLLAGTANAIAAAGASAGGGFLSNILPNLIGPVIQAIAGQRTNEASLAMMRENRSWEEMMSNTAHQREVGDLTAAGLNPTLSAHGSGASTPTAPGANFQTPQIQLPDMMAYGISLKQLSLAEKKLEIDRENSAATIAKHLSETDLIKLKQILAGKGMPRAQLEGEASGILSNVIKYIKTNWNSNKQPSKTPHNTNMFNGELRTNGMGTIPGGGM